MTRGGNDASAATPSSPSPRARTDEEIIARIQRPRNNREMSALWKGETSADYPSVSAGDVALCTYLALSTGNDEARIDGLFRRSGRYRDEWDAILDPSANSCNLRRAHGTRRFRHARNARPSRARARCAP